MEIIKDGTGKGYSAKIDSGNNLHTVSIQETKIQNAVSEGNAYNINTGEIALTSSTESAVLYFKNNESPLNSESGISIDTIIVGVLDGGTVGNDCKITILKNPTAGTIVSNATAVDMNQNRNFGSSNTLDSLAYKGAEGYTFTDGEDFGIVYQSQGSRAVIPIDVILEKGNSIGVKIDTNTNSGTTNVYAALVLHRIDGSIK